MSTRYRYTGQRRDGTNVAGSTTRAPEAFVLAAFMSRWRRLNVYHAGELVGAIGAHPDTGRRTWWADTTTEAK